ncbi:MAG: bifunctional metallophosphatase/5'-nucleotidase [Bacteroidia bacterium]
MEESLRINRRSFIKTSASAAVFALAANSPLSAFAKSEQVKIVILYTNDWHSHIEPFGKDDKQFAGLGGAASRSALIKKIRGEEKNILLLDAGDIFQGTPYFNFFEGELEYKLMSEMGYDLATLGNHDFDNGIEGIVNQLRYAKFEFVNCNYDFTNTLLSDKVKPYKIFKKSGIKIGVFGLGIELKGLVPDELYGNIKYRDPVLSANQISEILRMKEKCDLVICLSHLGYKYRNEKVSDIVLANQSKYIDLIIGGHTHTFLSNPDIRKNALGKEVLITQVGWAGINLGKIDYYFEPLKNKVPQATSAVMQIGGDRI